ncbi:hypothetical protein EA127_27990, partial [Salmonella enterica subsp. diarizonae serovar 48:i:z]|nr:hypothetical protein [Salmonella enterica subsp. diarizonae serovar 48:i:z]
SESLVASGPVPGLCLPGTGTEPGAAGQAARTLRLHRERCLRLYEQACRQGLTHHESMVRVQDYRKRWFIHAGKLLR